MTRAQLRLRGYERQIKALYGFAIATAAECGGKSRPACDRLIKGVLLTIWQASAAWDRIETRINR